MANKRIQKKKISQAAEITAAALDNQQLLSRIKVLEEDKKRLLNTIEELKRKGAVSSRKIAVLKTQVKFTTTELTQYKKREVKLRSIIKTTKQQLTTTQKEIKALKPETTKEFGNIKGATKTREQIFEEYRAINIKHFIERLTIYIEFTFEELNEIEAILSSWSSQKIRDFIKAYKFNRTYYESDAVYYGQADTTLRDLKAEDILNAIRSF